MKLLITFWEEIGQFFVKNSILIISLVAGTAAKIAIDSRIKRLSYKEIGIKVVLSFFAGYTASRYMNSHGLAEQANWAVPLITLLGESIVMWVMGHSKKIIESVVFVFFPSKGKDDKPTKL